MPLKTHANSDRPALICHMHDYVRRGNIARMIFRWVGSRSDCVVAPSSSIAVDLSAAGIPKSKIRTIRNAVDLDIFRPDGKVLDLDQKSGLQPATHGVMRVGLIATFAHWKGHRTFLRALGLLPSAIGIRAYVIGGPIYQTAQSQVTLAELQEAAKRDCPSINVGFTGALDDVEAAYRSLDVVVHASIAPEPFGLVIVEAMASGVPVIVSRSGGACELFEEGITALSHAPGDATELAEQIVKLAGDARLNRVLRANALTAARERFAPYAMGTRFGDLYEELADRRRRRC